MVRGHAAQVSYQRCADHSMVAMTTLTPHLGTIDQLYQKVLRERYRVWHARDFTHKADHFYNFCITVHSLRDYFLAHMGWLEDNEKKQEHHVRWNSDEVLRAVKEIANSAKHFSLRKPPQTEALEETTDTAVDVYDDDGELILVPVVIPDLVVTMASGKEYGLWEIMWKVSEYWRMFLADAGIAIGDDPHYFPDEVGKRNAV